MYRKVVKLLAQCMIVLLVAITLSSCGQGEDVPSTGADDMPRKAAVDSSKVEKMLAGADGQLVYRNDYTFTEKGYRVPYLDYDELCLKDGEEILTTGKYADITPDGKIDWANKDGREFYKEADAREMKMEDLVTLNDKPFRLPCKFADLGEEYAVFDKIDYSLMTDANLFPFTITDTQTGASITAYSKSGRGIIYFSILDKESTLLLVVNLDPIAGKIVGISTTDSAFSKLPVEVGRVQIGSTLNEMYEELGAPCIIFRSIKNITYLYQENEQEYVVRFSFGDELPDAGNRLPTKGRNIISGVEVELKEEEE